MNETKIKGLVTELQCQTYFSNLGYNVSVPLGEDCRYDLIVDIEGLLLRIQVKHANPDIDGNGFTIKTRSTQSNTQKNETFYYDKNQIDYFATYFNEKCYLIKVEECSSEKHLVFKKDQTAQNLADEYLAEKEIQRILHGEESVEKAKIIRIYQYDLRNNLVATYENACQAAEALGNRNKNSGITRCINGHRKTAFGFKWTKEPIN